MYLSENKTTLYVYLIWNDFLEVAQLSSVSIVLPN